MYYYPKKKKKRVWEQLPVAAGMPSPLSCKRLFRIDSSTLDRRPLGGERRSSVKLSIHHHIIFSILKKSFQHSTDRKCAFFFPFYRKGLSNLLVPGSNKCPVMPSRAYLALYTLDTAVLKEPNIILIVRFCAVSFHLNEKIKSF